MIINRLIILEMTNISGKYCRENENTFLFSNFFPASRAIYETMWKNVVDPDGLQMTI
jgi:hypothetical protein